MTVTYGFYDSLNGDRKYNAQQMSQLFKGVISDGVFQTIGSGFNVSAPGSMFVSVNTGRAWFNYTWTDNDAPILLSVLASEPVLPRIDSVVIEVNSDISTRANSIKVIKGTPASSPVPPTMANTATLHQYPIADIYVAAGVTVINLANITIRVGTSACPFATGAVPTYNFSPFLVGWEAQFSAWFNNLVNQLSGSQVANLQGQIDVLNSKIGRMDNYMIVPEIVSNNLMVSVKTLAGTDPSPSNPIIFKINNAYITLQSALSITLEAGFNVCGAGSVETANQNMQMFVYIGYRTSDSTLFLVVARVPYVSYFNLFSSVITNPLYGAYTGATPTGGDRLEVIGRINVSNSGTPNYNWTVVGGPIINRPIYETDWMTHVGTVSVSAGTVNNANGIGSIYKIIESSVEYRPHISVIDAGTGSGAISLSTPMPIAALVNWGLGRENAQTGKMLYLLSDTNKIGMSDIGGGQLCVSGYNLDGHIIARIPNAP